MNASQQTEASNDQAAAPEVLTLLGSDTASGEVCGPEGCEIPATVPGGAASFADAETREILNLLGGGAEVGSCCGGSCCA